MHFDALICDYMEVSISTGMSAPPAASFECILLVFSACGRILKIRQACRTTQENMSICTSHGNGWLFQ